VRFSVQNKVAVQPPDIPVHSLNVQHCGATVAPLFQSEVPSMTKISSLVAATAIASLFLMGAASAQTSAPAKTEAPKTETTKTETIAPAKKEAAKPRTPGSLECSKQADEKGLKGKERKKFRSACKKEFADKEKTGADKAK
jgi:hypothetical protein